MSDERRHVVISGGSRGLGRAFVEDLLATGYAVSTFSRKRTEFVEDMAARHSGAFFFDVADLSDPASIPLFLDKAKDHHGRPFALINNAGIAADGVLANFRPSEVDRLLSVNLAGPLLLTRAVVREMLLGRGGRIINVSSIIGVRGYRGLAVYGATKAGLDGLTRALSRELGSRDITVNSIAPGYLETEMSEELSAGQRRQIVRRTPLGRLGTPDDVTGAVRFLLSDEARFITGQVLVIDGGITA